MSIKKISESTFNRSGKYSDMSLDNLPWATVVGGTETASGDYIYHTFTASGTLTVLTAGKLEYFILAGGGGGGSSSRGGGGAGGLNSGISVVNAGSISVVVGQGGSGGFGRAVFGSGTPGQGSQGRPSYITPPTTIAFGGGGGGRTSSGGSGAGGTGVPGLGVVGQGNDGNANAGGGAGSPPPSLYRGGTGTTAFSDWGLYTNTGELVSGVRYYAGGGGSNNGGSTWDVGGDGGGGNGAEQRAENDFTGSSPGLANTGGGGGGGLSGVENRILAGSSGGSGAIIVRYPRIIDPFVTNIGTGANDYIVSAVAQPDEKILLGGNFTTFSGTTVNHIVRLNKNGTIDAAFTTNTGTGANNIVRAIAIQSDGKIIIGGGFTTFNGTTVNRIVRLNSDGTRDTAFTTNTGTGIGTFGGVINNVAIQSDGKIVIGGNFTSFNGTTVNHIARLNSDGSLDTAFNTNTGTGGDFAVQSIAIQSNQKIVIGGVFTTFNETTVNSIARLNSDGSLDTAFNTNTGTGTNGSVKAIVIQTDGQIVVGGTFTTFNGTTVNRIARLSSDGVRDTTFTTNTGTGANNAVSAIAIQSDAKIVVGGDFSTFNGTTVNGIARLSSVGVRDTTFTTNAIGGADPALVNTIFIQADSQILLGGNFDNFSDTNYSKIARLKSDGSLSHKTYAQAGLQLYLDAAVSPPSSSSWTNLANATPAVTPGGTAPTFSVISDARGGVVFNSTKTANIASGLNFANGGFTISVWLKHTGVVSTARIQRYFSLVSTAPATEGPVLRHNTSSNASLQAYLFDSTNNFRNIDVPDQVISGNYYNFVYTYNGSVFNLYKNNVLINTFPSVIVLPSVTTALLSSTTEFFEGNMYVVQYYNRALYQTELNQNYDYFRSRFGI